MWIHELGRAYQMLEVWKRQVMLGEDIEQSSWIYALAAHEYYWGDGTRHILSDEEYDALTNILKARWEEIPKELQKVFVSKEQLGQGAVQIKLNRKQKSKAEGFYGRDK